MTVARFAKHGSNKLPTVNAEIEKDFDIPDTVTRFVKYDRNKLRTGHAELHMPSGSAQLSHFVHALAEPRVIIIANG